MVLSSHQKRNALVLVLVLLGGTIFATFGLRSQDEGEKSPNDATEELQKFVDREAGFSVSYPRSWVNLTESSNEPLTRLLVGPEGVDDSLTVQALALPGPVVINADTPPEEMQALEATFDAMIDGLPGLLQVIEKNRINVNGTQGWYYIYRFNDPTTSENGIHFRYFLFEGDTQYMVTFQIFPEDHFAKMAPVFDRIIQTFNFELGRPSSRAPGSPGASPSSSG